MVSVNTLDKYTSAYTLYKKSLSETKILEYSVRRLEYGLELEDLDKLASVVTDYELKQLSKRIKSRNSYPDLPWL